MNLQEQISRIKSIMSQINENDEDFKKLYHLSTYPNRQSISKKGLLPGIGKRTKNWQELKKTESLKDYIYVMDYEPSLLDKSMYGFDVWEINPTNLDLNLMEDPNHTEFGGWYVTKEKIPPSNIKLISSDEKYDDCLINKDEKNKPEYCKDLDVDKLLGL